MMNLKFDFTFIYLFLVRHSDTFLLYCIMLLLIADESMQDSWFDNIGRFVLILEMIFISF